MIEREMLAASRSGVSLLNKGFGGLLDSFAQ